MGLNVPDQLSAVNPFRLGHDLGGDGSSQLRQCLKRAVNQKPSGWLGGSAAQQPGCDVTWNLHKSLLLTASYLECLEWSPELQKRLGNIAFS